MSICSPGCVIFVRTEWLCGGVLRKARKIPNYEFLQFILLISFPITILLFSKSGFEIFKSCSIGNSTVKLTQYT
jgi:hypothetical protein